MRRLFEFNHERIITIVAIGIALIIGYFLFSIWLLFREDNINDNSVIVNTPAKIYQERGKRNESVEKDIYINGFSRSLYDGRIG